MTRRSGRMSFDLTTHMTRDKDKDYTTTHMTTGTLRRGGSLSTQVLEEGKLDKVRKRDTRILIC